MIDSEEKAQWVDTLVKNPRTLRPAPVSVEQWRDIQQLAAMERMLSARGAPPVDQDPVAALVGLVPSREVVLDGPQLKRLRGATSISELASQLQQYGWDVTSSEVRRWQGNEPVQLPPALVERLAHIVGTTVAQITREMDPKVSMAVVRTPRWDAAVTRLARLLGLGHEAAHIRLSAVVMSTAFRHESEGSQVEAAEAYVAQLENSHEA